MTTPAAEPARVQFEVIENPSLYVSAPSADDWTYDQSEHPETHPDHHLPWFKPGTFYWRRSLREAEETHHTEKARGVASVVADEFKELANWTCQQDASAARFQSIGDQLRLMLDQTFLSLAQAVQIGRMFCCELERLQAFVQDTLGLIPPRWIADPSESAEKGWEERE